MKFPKVPINTSKYQKFLKVPRSTEWSNDQDISAILESKLDSVPELSSVTHSATSTTSATASQATSTAAESSPAPETSEKVSPATEDAEASPAEAEPQVGFTDEQQISTALHLNRCMWRQCLRTNAIQNTSRCSRWAFPFRFLILIMWRPNFYLSV